MKHGRSFLSGIALCGLLSGSLGWSPGAAADDDARSAATAGAIRTQRADRGELSGDGQWVADWNFLTDDDAVSVNVTRAGSGISELVMVNPERFALYSGKAWNPRISHTGRYVAYQTNQMRAVDTIDQNGRGPDVLLTDRTTSEHVLVSRTPDGSTGDDESGYPAISPDGRFVVFASDASDLIADDTNGERDLFLFDADAGRVERIVEGVSGARTYPIFELSGPSGQEWDGDEWADPSVSRGGRYVVFESRRRDLVPGDTNDAVDVFRFDRVTKKYALVSASTGGTPGDGDSFDATMTTNGRFVAFTSLASDLVPGDDNAVADVLLKDMTTGVLRRVSSSDGGDSAAIADGALVVYRTTAGRIVLADARAGWTEEITVDDGGVPLDGVAAEPQVSADARFVHFHFTPAGERYGHRLRIDRNGTAECLGLASTIQGTPGHDMIVGTAGVDVIVGLGGDDLIRGLAGDDVICGGDGDDRMWGEAGADRLLGGPGNDVLGGNGGDDRLDGGEGNDRLFGSRGDDAMWGRSGDDILRGGSGNDMVSGGDGANVVAGNRGDDQVQTGAEPGRVIGGVGFDRCVGDVQESCEASVTWFRPLLLPDDALPVSDPGGGGRFVLYLRDGQLYLFDRSDGSSDHISVNRGGRPGNGRMRSPVVTEDGRFVAFMSTSDNLVPGDNNRQADAFVVDRRLGTIERVSVGTDGREANRSVDDVDISADGRFVAFSSWARTPGEPLGTHVYVRDRQERTTTHVTDGGQEGFSFTALGLNISEDGSTVAFVGSGWRLHPDENSPQPDLFVWDVAGASLELLTRRACPGYCAGVGEEILEIAGLSADGRYVAAVTTAANLDPWMPITDATHHHIYVWDRLTGERRRIDEALIGPWPPGLFAGFDLRMRLSADGSRLGVAGAWAAVVIDLPTLEVTPIDVTSDGFRVGSFRGRSLMPVVGFDRDLNHAVAWSEDESITGHPRGTRVTALLAIDSASPTPLTD